MKLRRMLLLLVLAAVLVLVSIGTLIEFAYKSE